MCLIPALVTRVARATTGSLTTVSATGRERYTPSLLPTATERVVVVDDQVVGVGEVEVAEKMLGVEIVLALVLEPVLMSVVALVLVLVLVRVSVVVGVLEVVLTWVSLKRSSPVSTGGTQCTEPSHWRIAGTVITPSPSPSPSPCAASPCPKIHTSATAALSTESTIVERLADRKLVRMG